jgi:hypothetical protein
VKDVKCLQNDICVGFPSDDGRLQDLVSVHSNDTMADPLVFRAGLYATEKLDSNPLLGALAQRSHDFVDTALLQVLRLEIVDVLLVILTSLLLARLPRNGSIPAIAVVNAEGLNCSVRQLGGIVGLSSSSDETGAVRLPAVARLGISAVSIDVVVEDEFFAGFDSPLGEDAHAQFIPDHPLVDKAIRIARVIAEAAEVTLLRRIDELTLGEGHEIEMLNTFFVILDHASAEGTLINDLPDIFEDEIAGFEIAVRAQSETLLLSLDDCHIGILFPLEALVLAGAPAGAVAHALHLGRAINAVGIFAAGIIDS